MEGRRGEREGGGGKGGLEESENTFIGYLLPPQMWCGTKSGKIYIFHSKTYAEGKGVSHQPFS